MEVNHDKKTGQFFIDLGGAQAKLSYKYKSDQLVEAYSTFVPDAGRGKGIAGLLADDFFKFVKEEDLKVQPTCSYISNYMDKHPELKEYKAL